MKLMPTRKQAMMSAIARATRIPALMKATIWRILFTSGKLPWDTLAVKLGSHQYHLLPRIVLPRFLKAGGLV